MARITSEHGRELLNLSVGLWCAIAVAGQLIFAAYVVLFYGGSVASGHIEHWNKVLPRGYAPGDTFGNLMVGLHLAFTGLIILGGAAQLLPSLRRHWPGAHRWNGRLFMSAALVLSLGGLVMVWTRSSPGRLAQHIAISLNALVILLCAALAWRHARARRIDQHRRWALRLFLAVSGVWFFRVGLMAWLAIHQAPVGFDPKTFTGPFLIALNFAQFLVPLAVLELYFRAQATPKATPKLALAGFILCLTALTALGIFAATMGMWLPRM